MAVLYFLIPLAGVLVVASLVAFHMAARDGQFDDLETPPLRVLFDDDTVQPASPRPSLLQEPKS